MKKRRIVLDDKNKTMLKLKKGKEKRSWPGRKEKDAWRIKMSFCCVLLNASA